MRSTLATLPERIEHQKDLVKKCTDDMAAYAEGKTELSAEEAKTVREKIEKALMRNAAVPHETELMTYQGFKIMLPAYMSPESPYVHLVRSGRYYVPLGAESGMKRRIDNFLENLSEQREKYRTVLKSLRDQHKNLSEELQKPSPYSDRLAELRERLDDIDRELGVDAEED